MRSVLRLSDRHVPPRVIERWFPLPRALGSAAAVWAETRLPRCPRTHVGRWGGYRDTRAGRCLLSVRKTELHTWMPAGRDAVSRQHRAEPPTGDAGALVEDGERPIEALVNLDGGLRIAAAQRPGQELEVVRGEGDRVVVADDALILEAEDGLRIEPGRPGAIRRRRIRRRLSEARIVAGQEVSEEGVRAVAIGDPGQAQFSPQAILEGAKEPLDATFIWYENVGCTLLLIGCGQLAAVLW